jgi:uncharacterized OsmC-like protein
MNRGVPPTARKARTGEFTPPGMTRCARSNSSADFDASTSPVCNAGAMSSQSPDLRTIQEPLKQRYRDEPESARLTLHATSDLDDGVSCRVQTAQAMVTAGLHPYTGGDGSLACSGDMLLEALAACAGVTMRAVATSMGIAVSGQLRVEGDLDFRGTLGVDKTAPVGFTAIRVHADIETDASDDQRATLLRLTERYCVVLQTIRSAPTVAIG